MTQGERDYLLNIINIQSSMLEAYAQKNMNKFVLLERELETVKKASFKEFMAERSEQRKSRKTRFKNLITELEAVVKEME